MALEVHLDRGVGDVDVPIRTGTAVEFAGEEKPCSNSCGPITCGSKMSPARLARKPSATAAKLCYSGHLLMENRNALFVDAEITAATGYAERDCAVEMLARLPASKRRRTIAADKAHETRDFVAKTRGLGFTPHVAQDTTNRRSAIDGRATRHPGHIVSQRISKHVEEPSG